MPLSQTIASLQADPRIGPNFTFWHRSPPMPATFASFPTALDARLVEALQATGISHLYSHQAETVDAVLSGRNAVVVTPTASGKTLCYNLPVLNELLRNPEARALYLFPTKALAQDQLAAFNQLNEGLGGRFKAFTYDGDTPADARKAVRTAGNVVVTNPDMLHSGILPHHTRWLKLFENLRYVVIDELHQYRGVFGSHVANVIRRLRRICRFYGSDPVFICCSATIANPGDLAEALIDAPVSVVDRNGAPTGEKVLAVYNPPVINKALGIRGSALGAAQQLTARLLRDGAQTIAFAPSRQTVELMLRHLREAMPARHGETEAIEGYRSGYLPSERRAIEAGLRSGRVRGVVSTNALELGIDIGSLQAAVLLGYPGTLASTWQQIGRAGRRDETSLAVLVTNSTALNQYIARHPEFLLAQSPETGLINRENLAVRISHLKSAAFELPVEADEDFGPETAELLGLLGEESILHANGERFYWMAESYPAQEVSLRSSSIDNFVIIETGPKPQVIGELDRPSAPLLIHEEAIYMHGGQQYHVDRLDWDEKKAYVRAVDVDYYTNANLAVDLKVLEVASEREDVGCTCCHGDVAVSYLATIFKKLKLDTHENVGWGKISIPQEDMHTTAYWVSLNGPFEQSRSDLQAGLSGVANLLSAVAPLFLLCDPRDLHTVPQIKAPFSGRPTVYLYETRPGGVGFAEGLFGRHRELIQAALDLVRECPCPGGCPSCVGPSVDESPRAKRVAIELLERLVIDAAA